MNARKGLVLDANILIRAVFGQRVRQILEAYEDVAGFYSPDVCFQDAGKYIPDLSERRGFDPAVGLSVLDQIGRMVEPVDRSLYEDYENLARELFCEFANYLAYFLQAIWRMVRHLLKRQDSGSMRSNHPGKLILRC
jgi:PIN domain-containing protein